MKNRPLARTAGMGILALIFAGLAAYYYPWPEIERQNSQVGQSLFKEFPDKTVSFIEVEAFNSDTQALERINLQRRGEKWMLPKFSNFNADLTAQIANAIGSLRTTVLDMVSDRVEDHTKFGVIDPQEYSNAPNKSVLGRKLTLLDSNRGEVASLIVGLEPQDVSRAGQRYVRIPGQPEIYLLNFDANILQTRLGAWVDPNLLKVNEIVPQKITIENFVGEGANTKPVYRAQLELATQKYRLAELTVPRAEGWQVVTPDDGTTRKLEEGIRFLGTLSIVNVQPKSPELTLAFRRPTVPVEGQVWEAADKLGFFNSSPTGVPAEVQGKNGRIELQTEFFVKVTMNVGAAEATNQTRSKLCRWVCFVAVPELDRLPEPTPPAGGDSASDEEKQKFAQAKRDWEQKIANAEKLANNLNALHAGWYYAIDEDVIGQIRPELALSQLTPSSPAPPAESATDDN